MRRNPGLAAAVAIGLLLFPGSVFADRLHLEGGGTLETAHWWVEGDTLYYETAAGTVGIPRGRILRIEKTATRGKGERA